MQLFTRIDSFVACALVAFQVFTRALIAVFQRRATLVTLLLQIFELCDLAIFLRSLCLVLCDLRAQILSLRLELVQAGIRLFQIRLNSLQLSRLLAKFLKLWLDLAEVLLQIGQVLVTCLRKVICSREIGIERRSAALERFELLG